MKIRVKIKASGGDEKDLQPGSIEVKEQLKQATTFTITYADDICDGDYQVIQKNYFDPFKEIEIWAVLDDKEYCLVKGLVQNQSVKLVHGGNGSTVKITGSDNSIKMGWVTETKNWKKKVEDTDIAGLLSRYFGESVINGKSYKKAVAQAPSSPPPKGQNGQVQRSDDLQLIKQQASKRGMYFWISYDEKGNEIAHFDKLPLKEFDTIEADKITTLSINRENNDLDNFTVSWDANRPVSVESNRLDPKKGEKTENEIPKSTQPKLGQITLAGLTKNLVKIFQSNTAMDAADQKERNEAALNEAEWFIKASCTSNYSRLCRKDIKPLHAHSMIAIDGAGSKHSGAYLVAGVTHTITDSDYTISLELLRNAWNGPLKTKNTTKLPGNAGLG